MKMVVPLVVLAVLAPASAYSSSWVKKGETNENLARKFLTQWIDTNMSSTDGAWAQYIAHPNADNPLVAHTFTWIINANGLNDTSYSMQGTTWPEMMTKHMVFYAWLGNVVVAPGAMDPSLVAIDAKSGGRKILATATWYMAAGSGAADGAGIPGTTTSMRVFVELDFNDDHKIEVITWSVDSGILEKLRSESRSLGDDQLLAALVNRIPNASGASVGLFVFGGLCGSVVSYMLSRRSIKQPALLG
jgi:hypothetical protein